MRVYALIILPLSAALLALSGCDPMSATSKSTGLEVKNPAAVVDGYKVAPELIDLYSEARTRRPFGELPPEQKKEVLDEALDLIAIAVDARNRGLDKDPKIAARVELQSLNVLAQASITEYVSNNEIGDEQLKAEYDEQYVKAPKQEYKARHILLKTEDEAKAVIKDLEGGADFAELAKTKSTGPSGPNGGDLGWFARDAMVKPFADAVAEMESGTFTKIPVQTQFGYHVILSEGSRTAPAPDFESVKGGLQAGAQQTLVQDYVDSVRGKAKIETMVDFEAMPEPAAEPPAEPAADADADADADKNPADES